MSLKKVLFLMVLIIVFIVQCSNKIDFKDKVIGIYTYKDKIFIFEKDGSFMILESERQRMVNIGVWTLSGKKFLMKTRSKKERWNVEFLEGKMILTKIRDKGRVSGPIMILIRKK